MGFSARAIPHRVRWATPSRLFRGALIASAFLIFAWPVALDSGLVAGSLSSVFGSLFAERLAARRYRLAVIFVFSGLIVLGGFLLTRGVVASALIPMATSATVAMHVAEVLRFGSLAFAAALSLRALAIRYRAALAIEGALVVLAIATTVAAHRDGMIARPLEISDWFWTQGIDPVVAFLAIGLVGVLLLAAVLTHGRSPGRTIAQLAFVLILGSVLAVQIHGRDLEGAERGADGKAASKDDSRSNAEHQSRPADGPRSADGERPFANDLPSGGKGAQNRPAAIVVFHKDVAPSTGIFYFRHAVFSQYNGVRLVQATLPGIDQDGQQPFPTTKVEIKGVHAQSERRTLVATDVALLSEHHRAFLLLDAMEISPLPNPEPARFRGAYHVVSSVLTEGFETLVGSTEGDPTWSDEIWDHYRAIPMDDRYTALAADLRATLRAEYSDDPFAKAIVVKKYLEKNATYSFSRTYDGEQDPTAAFLFSEEKIGYCVHLAHAATFLLRAMGVPARVSAGYAVPAANLGGGSALLIKSGDAHAWAEIYLDGTGWIPIEVTPEKTDVKPSGFQERDLQSLLGEMARKEGREARPAYQGPRVMDAVRAFLRVVPKVALLLLAFAYSLKLWRILAPFFASRKRLPRVAYRAALDRLSAGGFSRAAGEPRERFARRVGGVAPSFSAVTSVHVGFALGSRRNFAEAGALARLSRLVGREVRQRVPLWRWVLGVLNPISWIWSR